MKKEDIEHTIVCECGKVITVNIPAKFNNDVLSAVQLTRKKLRDDTDYLIEWLEVNKNNLTESHLSWLKKQISCLKFIPLETFPFTLISENIKREVSK